MRTPGWARREIMQWFYDAAASCNGIFQVDHIIPLQGELVSGLNVETNLQFLPPDENARKCNKFDNDSYQEWRLRGEVGSYLP